MKRLVRKPDSLVYSVKLLNKSKRFSFLGRRLDLYKCLRRLKKKREKSVKFRFLHTMKRGLFFSQVLRYFFLLCLRNILEFSKNSENVLLFLKSFFSSHFTRISNNFFYFFLGFFYFLKFNSSFNLDKKFFKRSSFKLLLR